MCTAAAANLQDLLHRGHAELQRAIVHEAQDVTEPGRRQPLHVDLVLVPFPHVRREHDPEVVALGGQQSLVGLEDGKKKSLYFNCYVVYLPIVGLRAKPKYPYDCV